MEWNKLSSSIRNSTYPMFRNHLPRIIRPVSNPVYSIQNYIGLKLLTKLRLCSRHLKKPRFNHDFQNFINSLCTCSLEVESTAHNIKVKLLNSLELIDTNLLSLSEEQLTKVFLYGFSQLDQNQNRHNFS